MHGRFHLGMWVRPLIGRKNELLAGQSLRPGGVTNPLAEASGQAMYPCLVPVLSASAGGEDARDGVPMRWGGPEA